MVGNFNGTITLYDTGNMSKIKESNGTLTTAYTVNVNGGSATFTVESQSLTVGASDTLTATGTTSTGTGLAEGTLTLTSVAPTATGLSLSASPATLDTNGLNNYTTLTVTVTDAAGNTYVGTPEQVTLNLSGPGSFTQLSAGSPNPTTSETLYVNGSLSIPVYGVESQTGTIAVTASAAGLTSANLSIPAVISGIPAKLAVTSSTGTTPGGVPYVEYKVQLEDAAGNPITSGLGANDAITISDNTNMTGGNLSYWTWNSTTGQPGSQIGTSTSNGAPVISTNLSNGAYTFAVETNGTGSTAPTITIDDTTENFSTTVTYQFQVGTASSVAFETNGYKYSALNLTQLYAEAGSSITLSAEVVDSSGNVVAKAGQTVDFELVQNSNAGTSYAAASLPNGSNLNTIYAVPTNAQGVASVTVTVNNPGTFQVAALLPGGTPVNGPLVFANAPQYAVTQIADVGWTSGVTNGSIATGNTATLGGQLENSVGAAISRSDVLLVTSSNPNILQPQGLTQAPNSTNQWTTTSAAAGSISIGVKGQLAGTATITVTDLSAPGVAPVSETLGVTGGTTVAQGTIYHNGLPVSTSNPLSVTANVPVLVQVEATDAGGNPVVVSAPTTLSLPNDLNLNGGTFLVDNNGSPGAPTSSVTIPAGQYYANVFYVNPNTKTITSFAVATVGSAANSTATMISASVTSATYYTAGNTTGVTFTVYGAGNTPVSGATVTLYAVNGSSSSWQIASSPTGAGSTSLTETTNSSGQVTVYITDTKAGDSGQVEAVATGAGGQILTTSTGKITIQAGAVSQYALSPNPIASPESLTAGQTVTVTLTAEDQFGNPVSGAMVYLSINSGAAGSATAGSTSTSLTNTPQSFTTDASGHVSIIYKAAGTLPSPGTTDTITAQNATSSPTITATDSYTY